MQTISIRACQSRLYQRLRFFGQFHHDCHRVDGFSISIWSLACTKAADKGVSEQMAQAAGDSEPAAGSYYDGGINRTSADGSEKFISPSFS
jgi:hypothetical protein